MPPRCPTLLGQKGTAGACLHAAVGRAPVLVQPLVCPNRTCHGASTSGRQHRPAARCPQVARTAYDQTEDCVLPAVPGSADGLSIELVGVADVPLTPRRISNRKLKGCLLLQQLVTVIIDDVAAYDNANTAHALNRLSKMYDDSVRSLSALDQQERAVQQQAYRDMLQPAVDALTARLHQVLGTLEPWDISLAMRAYARLPRFDDVTFLTLCTSALESVPLLKPIDCANIMIALARRGCRHAELLKGIVQAMLDHLEESNSVELTNVLWAFGRLHCHPGRLFLGAVLERVQWQAQQFSIQEVNAVLWALVRLRHRPDQHFMKDMQDIMLQRLQYMAPQDLCMSSWAFARLRFKAVELLDEVPQLAVPRLHEFKNQELCGLLSGYGFARHYHRVLLDSIADAVQDRIDALSSQEVAIVIWAYGMFRHRPAHPEFSRRLAMALHLRMPEFSAQGLAMVTKALAQLQWRSEALLVQLSAAAETRLNEFKPLELSQLLWGLSQLQSPDLGLYHAAARRCIVLLQNQQGPYYSQMRNQKVINNIVTSCQRVGYVPHTLIDYAESKGIWVMQQALPRNSRLAAAAASAAHPDGGDSTDGSAGPAADAGADDDDDDGDDHDEPCVVRSGGCECSDGDGLVAGGVPRLEPCTQHATRAGQRVVQRSLEPAEDAEADGYEEGNGYEEANGQPVANGQHLANGSAVHHHRVAEVQCGGSDAGGIALRLGGGQYGADVSLIAGPVREALPAGSEAGAHWLQSSPPLPVTYGSPLLAARQRAERAIAVEHPPPSRLERHLPQQQLQLQDGLVVAGDELSPVRGGGVAIGSALLDRPYRSYDAVQPYGAHQPVEPTNHDRYLSVAQSHVQLGQRQSGATGSAAMRGGAVVAHTVGAHTPIMPMAAPSATLRNPHRH